MRREGPMAILNGRAGSTGKSRFDDVVQPAGRAKRVPRHKHNRAALFFLAPWLLGLVLITLIPMVVSLYLSFTDFNLIRSGTEWVGLDNYVGLASDERLQ